MRGSRLLALACVIAVLPAAGLSLAPACSSATGPACCCPSGSCHCPGHERQRHHPGRDLPICTCAPALPLSDLPEAVNPQPREVSSVAAEGPQQPLTVAIPGAPDPWRCAARATPPDSASLTFLFDCALLI